MKKNFLVKNLPNHEKCCNIASSNLRQKRIILSSFVDFSFITLKYLYYECSKSYGRP